MMKCLLESDIGTNDLESFPNKQQDCRRSKGKGSNCGRRDKKEWLRLLMSCKITDNIQLESELRGERGRLRGTLERQMGGKTAKCMRNFIAKVKKCVMRHHESVRKKNVDKVRHLSMKNVDKSKECLLPETLSRYSAAAVF